MLTSPHDESATESDSPSKTTEEARRKPRRWVRRILITVVVLIVAVPIAAVAGLRAYVNDGEVDRQDSLFPAGEPKRLMAIWAHPDDEIIASGTISRMAQEDGAEVTLVYLTRGEAETTSGLAPDELRTVRSDEAAAAADAIGADNLEMLDFPDGGLVDADGAEVKKRLLELIDEHQPTTLVGFDDKVGLYGHPDHLQTGIWMQELIDEHREDDAFPVKAAYQATLPQPMIDVALKMSDAFRENYPDEAGSGLPEPSLAVGMWGAHAAKRDVLAAHASQVAVIGDVQPMYDKVPSWVYYWIFDREYFTQIL